eukprot:TRINITY_DN4794_c0_g1_i2.p1 TRINITY_DN4794_c0_g1~~TRINITY_DN4794_c0_g1_i2.p1  ORF type:complete len:528 (+),score=83.39 TRINITY_DN4794_c0_g1_i2:126-1586(+)
MLIFGIAIICCRLVAGQVDADCQQHELDLPGLELELSMAFLQTSQEVHTARTRWSGDLSNRTDIAYGKSQKLVKQTWNETALTAFGDASAAASGISFNGSGDPTTLRHALNSSHDNLFQSADKFAQKSPPISMNQHGSSMRGTSSQWGAVAILALLLLIALFPILLKEGMMPFATVVLYLSCNSLVKMFVKNTISSGLECPDFITLIHMISTATAAFAFELPRLDEALQVLPIALVTGGSLILNTEALLYGGVAFVSMIGCTTPAFVFVLQVVGGKRTPDFRSTWVVVFVVLGAILCVNGEATSSMLSFALATASTCFRAMKSVWQQDLLSVQISPLRLVFWSSLWSSILVSTPIMLVNEGTKGLVLLPATNGICKLNLVLSALAASILNISQCYAVKELGAVLQSTTGNLNLILVIALSQAWLNEAVAPWQYVGVVLMVLASVLRSSDKKDEVKTPSEPACSSEEPPETSILNSASGRDAPSRAT